MRGQAVQGAEVLTIGTDAWVQVVIDDARAQGVYRARRAWGRDTWKAERDKEKANKVAQQVKRAAVLTAELAAQSEKKTAAVCDQPPGLDELAWHIEAPNMVAGGSHPQATRMPDPWATYKCPSASQTKVSNLLSASQDLSSYSGKFRGRQKRSDMRAQEAASLIDETVNFFVKTTGKDEASMRQQLTGQKREGLRRNRDHWKARAEDEERFQKMKEEAWRLSERLRGMSSRRNSAVRSGKRRCKSGQAKCKGRFNQRSGDARPRRERQWNKKIPSPKDNEHGRNYGDQGSPSHRHWPDSE